MHMERRETMTMNFNKVSIGGVAGVGTTPNSVHTIEYESRDPNQLNKNVQIVWSSVIGEPESVQSPDWVWRVSTIIYTIVQSWTYKFLTVITAPLFALIIGLTFAILIFLQVWCIRPVLKLLHIIFSLIRTLVEIVANGVFGPLFETIGLCLSNLKLRHQRVYDAKDEPQYPFII